MLADKLKLDMKLGPQVNKLDQQNLSLWGINLVRMLGLLNQWVKLLMPLPLLLIQLALLQWVLVLAFDQLDQLELALLAMPLRMPLPVLMLLQLVFMDLLSSFPS